MTHRTALALSIVLTLVLATGILAGRERLFQTGATADISGLTSAQEISPDGVLAEAATSGETATGAAPRIIEIPLPVTEQIAGPRQGSEDERWERGDRVDDDDHERYEDDDEHGEDDDD